MIKNNSKYKVVVVVTLMLAVLPACGIDQQGRLSIPIPELQKKDKSSVIKLREDPVYTVSKSVVDEYDWVVGSSNPVDDLNSVWLTAVGTNKMWVNFKDSTGEDQQARLNIRVGTKVKLNKGELVITGIYPVENKVTFSIPKDEVGKYE